VRFASVDMDCAAISIGGFGARRRREIRELVRGAMLQAVSAKLRDDYSFVYGSIKS
jgi:hypothetical protein